MVNANTCLRYSRLCKNTVGPKTPNGVGEHCALGHSKMDLIVLDIVIGDCKHDDSHKGHINKFTFYLFGSQLLPYSL